MTIKGSAVTDTQQILNISAHFPLPQLPFLHEYQNLRNYPNTVTFLKFK